MYKQIVPWLFTISLLGLSGCDGNTPPAALAITVYALPTPNRIPYGITAGPDGNLWFTEQGTTQIGRITPSGHVTEFPVPTPDREPREITAGPDGNLWFTEDGAIGRITPGGQITQFALPAGDEAVTLTAGPGGTLWVSLGNQLGRLSSDGQIMVFALPTLNSSPAGITAGPDGNLWFTECTFNLDQKACNDSKIGRMTLPDRSPRFRCPCPRAIQRRS